MLAFSNIAWVLSQVTGGGGKETFVWVMFQKQYFDDLKKHLFSSPVRSLPYLYHPFEIETYALDYVVGTILTQHGHCMAFHSERLSYIVCKYPTYDK